MTQDEMSRYYGMLSSQSKWMSVAINYFERGNEQEMWYSLFWWRECKDIADEINNKYDNMAFSRAMGVSDGIKRAWE